MRIEDSGQVAIGYRLEAVTSEDAWDFVRTEDGTYYPRVWVQLEGEEVVVTIPHFRWVPDEEATSDLRQLLEKWRREGKSVLAERVEFAPPDGDIWSCLGQAVAEPAEVRRFPLRSCSFFKRVVAVPAIKLDVAEKQ